MCIRDRAYSHQWLLYDQLSQIWPIPQQSWDRTSVTGPVGNYDTTTAGAKAVYNFLNGQSEDEDTYATNPLWKTVDGPWLVSAFSPSTGYNAFVPNPHYTGPGKPKIAKFEELPFTSAAAVSYTHLDVYKRQVDSAGTPRSHGGRDRLWRCGA